MASMDTSKTSDGGRPRLSPDTAKGPKPTDPIDHLEKRSAEIIPNPNLIWWNEPENEDPSNPKNWSTSRKWMHVGILSSITFLTYAAFLLHLTWTLPKETVDLLRPRCSLLEYLKSCKISGPHRISSQHSSFQFVVGFGMISLVMCIQMYLADAFTIHAASATTANAVLRNLLGALLPLCGLDMYNSLGFGWGNSLLAFIALGLAPVPWLFRFYGERIRTNPKWKVTF